MSSLFKKSAVDMPNKSGFDMSHENFFTAKCGTLTPCLVDYLLPNDTVSVGFNAQIQLPPMATDFYGEVVGKYELFFVPYRILWGGWKQVIAPVDGSSSYSYILPYTPYSLAEYDYTSVEVFNEYFGAGSLADYLGCKGSLVYDGFLQDYFPKINLFPFLAYHKVYDDWYRDARVTNPCFLEIFNGTSYNDWFPSNPGDSGDVDGDVSSPSSSSGSNTDYLTNFPWLVSSMNFNLTVSFQNGHRLGELWQRNFPKDYFTNATTLPQAGDPASLTFSVNDGEGSFTIAGLRAANSLQMFMERNNIAGNRYQDRIKVQYDIYPADAVVDRALYLGSATVPVYCKSIFQNSSPSSQTESNNPFSSVGAKYGSSQGVGGGSLCKKFTASEHGILMCIFSLVPRRYYSSGVRRQLLGVHFSDIPFPSLAGVGDQEIFANELVLNNIVWGDKVFGYTQRYSEYKFMGNEVHGLLVDGNSLASFCLQSNFNDISSANGYPVICTDFIQIPTSYLDQVAAVNDSVSDFGCWNDTYFSYKKVSTLPAYSIPTLENMKNSHREFVNNGGSRL